MTTNLKLAPMVQTLTKAREVIEQRGWIQGNFHRREGYCLVGSIREVTNWDHLGDAMLRLVSRAIWGRARTSWYSWCPVYEWNDYPGRTKEQVIAVLDKAIALALGVSQP